MEMRIYDIIRKKRDGMKLNKEELFFFVSLVAEGLIPDYQTSALLMAIFINGMDIEETTWLTSAMTSSGDILDLGEIPGVKVDKHSTGGVGDKTTLVAAPIIAACGVPIAKLSGRALGHTGGTIDKLEAIPGFRTALTKDEIISKVRKIGLVIAGQTGNIAPADKVMYALRDATATVESIPLIASSIMSKKLASGAECILLDVKTGSGAFMSTLEKSRELARVMVDIGKALGKKVKALITDMDSPLGYAVGNAPEVIEAIETLKGKGPEDLTKLSVEIAAMLLQMAGTRNESLSECRQKAEVALFSFAALEKFREMVIEQGGTPDVIEDYSLFKKPEYSIDVTAPKTGYIERIRADIAGRAVTLLGAGREKKGDPVDPSAGIILKAKPGDFVNYGTIIVTLVTSTPKNLPQVVNLLSFDAFEIINQKTPPIKHSSIILDIVE